MLQSWMLRTELNHSFHSYNRIQSTTSEILDVSKAVQDAAAQAIQ